MLRNLHDVDAGKIADMHLRCFPGFFLSFLGPRFLRLYYESIAMSDQGIGIFFIDSAGMPLGFVVGAINPRGFYKRLLKRRWFAFCIASVEAVLRRPTIIPRLARAVLYPSTQTPVVADAAGLFSLGVLPEAQGKGVAKELVGAFLREASQRRCNKVILSSDRDNNEKANQLYRSMGFQIRRQYNTPEARRMNEYWIDLTDEFSAGTNGHA